MLYKTVDAINQGRFFWTALLAMWPMPFEIGKTDVVVLSFDDDDLTLLVCKEDRVDGVERRVLQVREKGGDDPLLEVRMTPEMDYINGNAFGMAVDEIGAVNTLNMVVPQLGGTWELSPADVLLEEGDQHV